jgi:hypothetical protein
MCEQTSVRHEAFRLLAAAVFAVIFLLPASHAFPDARGERAALVAALKTQDPEVVQRAVAAINDRLGARQGVPETPDRYSRIPLNATPLSNAEAIASVSKMAAHIAQHRWWRVGIDPTTLTSPLREPASAIVGLLAASRVMKSFTHAQMQTPKQDLYLDAAREAGDFLLWAQTQADTGVFPFPASRGNANSAAFRSAERQLARAEKKGLANVIKNGWAIEDDDDGGLQFDNGECGVAIFALYEATQDKKYLDAALRSAEWAHRRPLVANWNYNSFSVRLLSRAYLTTGNKKFLESATKKALLGVIPGQLTQGKNKGRWSDAHNAKPAYHYIMMDSLVELFAALRNAGEDKTSAGDAVLDALRLGLTARNRDFLAADRGAPTKETAMIALLNTNRVFAENAAFLRETKSYEARDALTKLLSNQLRRAALPVAPSALGLFLEDAVTR